MAKITYFAVLVVSIIYYKLIDCYLKSRIYTLQQPKQLEIKLRPLKKLNKKKVGFK